MLKIDQLRVAYGDIVVLRDLTLEVGRGELVALVGSNNSGKSTALKAVAGLIPTLSGTVTVDGQDITRLPAHKRAELGITLIPEAWQLFGDMTVAENLMMGAFLHRKDVARNKQNLEECLELFPALKDKLARKANNLSGGERQMVSMCRALMTRPRLLLIDEPSMGLAPVVVDQIFAIIEQLNAREFSILLVEQNLQLALHAADHGYVLEHGVVAMHGTGSELLSDSRVRERYLGI